MTIKPYQRLKVVLSAENQEAATPLAWTVQFTMADDSGKGLATHTLKGVRGAEKDQAKSNAIRTIKQKFGTGAKFNIVRITETSQQ